MHLHVLIEANRGQSVGFKCRPLEKTHTHTHSAELNFYLKNDVIQAEAHDVHSHTHTKTQHTVCGLI